MPIPVHVLLLKGPERSRAAQLLNSVIIAGGPPRGRDRPPVNPPGLQVVAGITDDVEEGVVGLVNALLADH